MKRLLLIPLALLLCASSCEEPKPPRPNSPYCYGEPTAFRQVSEFVDEQWQAIMGGKESVDRRATLRMSMTGGGTCTGVAWGPHTVLTAAHCTYDADNVTASLGGYSTPPYFNHVAKTEHPEYLQFVYRDHLNLDNRKSDIAVVQYGADRSGEAASIPGPYVSKVFDPLNPTHASRCTGFIAQGWGRWEGSGLSLRETPYDIDLAQGKLVVTMHTPGEGRICFGDSGGPLYAVMDDGELWLVGLTRTTGSKDCTIQSTHVRLAHFEEWLNKTIADHDQ